MVMLTVAKFTFPADSAAYILSGIYNEVQVCKCAPGLFPAAVFAALIRFRHISAVLNTIPDYQTVLKWQHRVMSPNALVFWTLLY